MLCKKVGIQFDAKEIKFKEVIAENWVMIINQGSYDKQE